MTYLIVEQFAPLAAGSLPFIAVLVYLKLRAQREQQKRANEMKISADRWFQSYGAQR